MNQESNGFIAVGENIHCTRIYKVGGKYVKESEQGWVIAYTDGHSPCELPIPDAFIGTADWNAGKVKHCAVAAWQGTKGDDTARAAGARYLRALAAKQTAVDAAYLDINVDEFSTDLDERIALMAWMVETVQGSASIPVSVDSSNTAILEAGLRAADPSRDRPMVNSVSLERVDAIEVAARHNAVVIASAAGEAGLPSSTDERLANLEQLFPRLREAGLEEADIHVDPLVFPISTDGTNGTAFLEAVSAIRSRYGDAIHIVAGLSNVSFGMPSRKLINQVFARLAVEAGADGGIVDPLQINARILAGLDTDTEPYRLARALLLGEDDFGMEFITASREGRLG